MKEGFWDWDEFGRFDVGLVLEFGFGIVMNRFIYE